MAPVWVQRVNIQVSENRIYNEAVAVGHKIYLLGFDSVEHKAALLSVLDLSNLIITDILSETWDWDNNSGRSGLRLYSKNIVFVIYGRLAVNLKTLSKKRIERPNSPPNSRLFDFTTVVNGSDIHYFSMSKPVIYIFDTINSEWRSVESSLYKSTLQGGKMLINGELTVLSRHHLDKSTNCVSLFNFEAMKWRKVQFSVPASFDLRMMVFFSFNGQIAAIKNSENALLRCFNRNAIGKDDFQMFVLDMKPSLQTMCAVKVLQCKLDSSEMPKTIQDQLKRYITE
ncbi:hypothetical protein CHUAL_007742 [Chamberlinius hualienensis]